MAGTTMVREILSIFTPLDCWYVARAASRE